MPSNKTVWSSDIGQVCPICQRAKNSCICRKKADKKNKNIGKKTTLKLDKKGRGGKIVTVIEGLQLNQQELKELSKELKRKCGTGGAIKDNNIEIQGDHRDLLAQELAKKDISAKVI